VIHGQEVQLVGSTRAGWTKPVVPPIEVRLGSDSYCRVETRAVIHCQEEELLGGGGLLVRMEREQKSDNVLWVIENVAVEGLALENHIERC
jgi:hypothetical protein